VTRPNDETLWRDEDLGLNFRGGTLDELQQGTFDAAAEAIRAGDQERATLLAAYTIEEALEPQEAYTDWTRLVPDFLARHGVSRPTIDAELQRIDTLVRAADGGPFDLEAGWAAFRALIGETRTACAAGESDLALARLEAARRVWLDHHDRFCDRIGELISAVARHLGEGAVEAFWDEAMARWYPNYDRFDLDRQAWDKSARQLLHMAVLALRGHLTGPGRRGDIVILDEGECWALQFRPCGSGGRSFHGEPEMGLPPRFEPPFAQAVVKGRHDWAWNKPGVCLYCTHCCQLGQRMPIRRLGYPTRVIDPPIWPRDRDRAVCTWRIYKHPSAVPAEAYAEVGERKPEWRNGRPVAPSPAKAGL